MSLNDVPAGREIPNDINVVIEIPMNADPVKYEMDKETGMLTVDRFMSTPMRYPLNYGFIPNTLGGDGDPLDVLVLTPYPLEHGAVIRCRPIGYLDMEDDGGEDQKLIAVPHKKLTGIYEHIKTAEDLPALLREQVNHFFSHYKDLEAGKWVKIRGWKNVDEAKALIVEGVAAASKKAA